MMRGYTGNTAYKGNPTAAVTRCVPIISAHSAYSKVQQ